MATGADPGLERSDDPRGRRMTTAPGLLLFGEDVAARTTVHRQPVWKLVVALDGELLLDPGGRPGRRAEALLVPPGTPHGMAATGAYRCLEVEPWVDPLVAVPGPVLLPAGLTCRLNETLARPLAAADLPAAAGDLLDRLRAGLPWEGRPPAGCRVRAAAAQLDRAGSLAELAADVGLSPVRLRELARAELGVPLRHLRLWARLRASAGLSGASLSRRAVYAGFSDQAHLTRTARRLVGRTPADLVGPPAARRPARPQA